MFKRSKLILYLVIILISGSAVFTQANSETEMPDPDYTETSQTSTAIPSPQSEEAGDTEASDIQNPPDGASDTTETNEIDEASESETSTPEAVETVESTTSSDVDDADTIDKSETSESSEESEEASSDSDQDEMVTSDREDAAQPLAPQTYCQINIGEAGDNNPYTYTFSAASHGITNFTWNFGADANPADATGPGPHNVTYSSPGLKSIALNCDALPQLNAQVNISTVPVPNFTVFPANPQVSTLPVNVQATNNSSPEGLTYLWEITGQPAGDATVYGTSTDFAPSFALNGYGIYTIQLTATDAGGQSQSITRDVNVSAPPPLAVLNVSPTSGVSPLTIDFNGIDQGGGPITSWEFIITGPGGFNQTVNAQNGSTTLTTTGTYEVHMNFSGPGGANFATRQVVVGSAGEAVTASFDWAIVGGTATTSEICFTNNSGGPIATNTWNFGDGTPPQVINDSNFCRTFNVPPTGQTFAVRLDTQNANGTSTADQTRNLPLFPPPVASFTFTPGSPITWGQLVNFNDTSTGQVDTYSWKINGVEFSTSQNPANQPIGNMGGVITLGSNEVELTVTGPGGTHTTSQIIFVQSLPVTCEIAGDLVIVPPGAAATYNGTVNDLNGRNVTYNWTLTPDGSSIGTGSSVDVNWPSLGQGTYSLTFSALTEDGSSCSRTVTVSFDYQPVDCQISGPASILPNGQDFEYVANVLNLAGRTVSYEWFVDGNSQGVSPATYNFSTTTPATYDISYTATVQGGITCEETITVTAAWPALTFTIDPTGPTTIAPNATQTYAANVSGDLEGRTLVYRWYVDGVLQGGATGQTFDFSTAVANDYVVSYEVDVVHPDGVTGVLETQTRQANITVAFATVVLNVTGPANGVPGGSGTYNATIADAATLQGRTVTARRWYVTVPGQAEQLLGGETGESLNYNYGSTVGNYILRAEWDLSDGTTIQNSRTTNVQWPTLGANITGPGTLQPGQTGTYTANVTGDLEGRTLTYRWYVNGDLQGGATGQNFDYSNNAGGNYTISVQIDVNEPAGLGGNFLQTLNANTGTVNVTWPDITCPITGPGTVLPTLPSTPNPNNHTYTWTGTATGADTVTYAWSVTPNGTFDGATDGTSANISWTVAEAGQGVDANKTLTLTVTANYPSGNPGDGTAMTVNQDCERTINVRYENLTCPVTGPATLLTTQDGTYTINPDNLYGRTPAYNLSLEYDNGGVWQVLDTSNTNSIDSGQLSPAGNYRLVYNVQVSGPDDDCSGVYAITVNNPVLNCPVPAGPATLLLDQTASYTFSPVDPLSRTPAINWTLTRPDATTLTGTGNTLSNHMFDQNGTYNIAYTAAYTNPDDDCSNQLDIAVGTSTFTCLGLVVPDPIDALDPTLGFQVNNPSGRTLNYSWRLEGPVGTNLVNTTVVSGSTTDNNLINAVAALPNPFNVDNYQLYLDVVDANDANSNCALDVTRRIGTLSATLAYDAVNSTSNDPNQILIGDQVCWTSSSSSTVGALGTYAIEWDLGTANNSLNTQTSTDPNLTCYTYTAAGNYTVSFTARTLTGSFQQQQTVNINVFVVPDLSFARTGPDSYTSTQTFTPDAPGITGNLTWTITETVSGNPVGTSPTVQPAGDPLIRFFPQPAGAPPYMDYTITVTGIDQFGDTQTSTQEIRLFNPGLDVSAAFVPTPALGEAPMQTCFNDLSTASTGNPIHTWEWDFGNGQTLNYDLNSIPTEICTTYNDPGQVYAVTLRVANEFGLSADASNTVETFVLLSSVANFNAVIQTDERYCFTPQLDPGFVVTQWRMGDGTIITPDPANPNGEICHSYAQGGIYSVAMDVTDGVRSGTITQTISVSFGAVAAGSQLNTTATCRVSDGAALFTVRNDGGPMPNADQLTITNENGQVLVSETFQLGTGDQRNFAITNQTGNLSLNTQNTSLGVNVDCTDALEAALGISLSTDATLGVRIPEDELQPGAPDWSGVPTCSAGCPPTLVYHTNENGNWEVFRLDGALNGETIRTNLTHGARIGADDMSPSRSPNSQWIVFTSNRATEPGEPENWELYVASISGDPSSVQRLTYNNFAHDMSPMWGPNNFVVFQTTRHGSWDLYMIDMETGQEYRLTDGTGNDTNPFWSPDGQQIVFQSDRENGVWGIYVLDMHTLTITRISNGDRIDVEPQFSPDGRTIAYRSYTAQDETGILYLTDARGSQHIAITESGLDATNQAWSPSGAYLAFQGETADNLHVYVYEVSSQSVRQLTNDASLDYAPTWRCSDDMVVFNSNASGTPDLFEVETLPMAAPPVNVMAESERLTFEEFDNIYPQNSPTTEFASREGRTLLGVFGEQTSFLMPETSLTEIDLSIDGLIRDDWREINSCPAN